MKELGKTIAYAVLAALAGVVATWATAKVNYDLNHIPNTESK